MRLNEMMSTASVPQRCALIVLAASGGSLTNPELLGRYHIRLGKPHRDAMVAAGWLSVRPGPPMRLYLTDAGWAAFDAEAEASCPGRSGSAGQALWGLLQALGSRQRTMGGSLSDLLKRDAGRMHPGKRTLLQRIRSVYDALVRSPGDWLPILSLRLALIDVDRETLDRALHELRRQGVMHWVPETDQALLTRADRQAALVVGPGPVHYLRFEREPSTTGATRPE